MKEFVWNCQCLYNAWKYRKEHETMEHQYQWYRYLVLFDLEKFFKRFKFWNKEKNDLPF